MVERLVIDASVAVKWYLPDASEEDTDPANEILLALLSRDLELHAPRVFPFEVCHTLTNACKRNIASSGSGLRMEDALRCVRSLFQLPIHLADSTEAEGVESLNMAVEFSKTYYDMTYVRLAERLDCRWCTSDRKAAVAVHSEFPRDRIVLLDELRAS